MTVAPGLCLAPLMAAQEVDEHRAENKARSSQPPVSLRLTDEVISKAVRETLTENRTGPREPGRTLSGDKYQQFSREFSEAQKPSCLGPDALKFQPNTTVIGKGAGGWVAGATGIFALPFLAAAVVRGKCG